MSKKKDNPVTIIIPVYADWDSLKDCINSLKRHVDNRRNRIIFVNDCGPQADILEKHIKNTIRGQENIFYYRNSKNLGFLKTCNRAVYKLDKTNNDVLLLNSDTVVTEGFLEELCDVLGESSKIGAVSPRTNNATIATIPISSMGQKGIDPKKSFKLFLSKKEVLPKYVEVPTAHGFCILIRRSLIVKFGLFDEIFGKGYGEEVDFCRRIRKHGYKSVLSNRSYVFHMEARSFTMERKRTLIEASSKIINKRYPEYSGEVREYIKQALFLEDGITDENQTVGQNQILSRFRKKLHKFFMKILD